MENKKAEEFTKSILSNSKLDIENPDFNKIVMDKIRRQNKKQILFQNLKYYSLTFVGIDMLIIALLRLFNIRIIDIPSRINNIIVDSISGQLILIYFTLLIAAILLITSISGNGYLHSKYHETVE